MDEDAFWRVIDAAGVHPTSSARLEVLAERLTGLPDADLLAFDRNLRAAVARANQWRLWAAGYLLQGGMSDDGFEYFRLWLVLQGRSRYESALADPDTLADLPWDEEDVDEAESLAYLAAELLEDRGSSLPDHVPADGVDDPAGEPFPEDDDEWFRTQLPRLWERIQQAPPEQAEPDQDEPAPRRGRPDPAPPRTDPPTPPLTPLLAGALDQLAELDRDSRPMLAANWLAGGGDGDALRDLAWLSGGEREVDDLWPEALADLGVHLPLTRARRIAMSWAAGRVLRQERSLRWLASFFLPDGDEAADDPELDAFGATFDRLTRWAALSRFDGPRTERARAERTYEALGAVAEALAREDLDEARRLLEDLPAGQRTNRPG